MTDPTGKVFISYRRKRRKETDQLIRALHDRGVPTWRDVDNLVSEPTEGAIRATLNDPQTSGAVLWLTPDIVHSPVIKNVEVPLAVARRRKNDAFWLIIVLADGLNYDGVTELFADSLGGEDLSAWNLTKTSRKWATPLDIQTIANAALEHRVKAVTKAGPARRVSIHAKGTMLPDPADELALDWTPHFLAGAPTEASWAAMAAAAGAVSRQIKKHTSVGQDVHYAGTPSMAAALLLGSTYSTRDGRAPVWMQRQPDGGAYAPWRLADAPDSAVARSQGWRVDTVFGDMAATDLAVCVSVNDEIAEAFARSRDITPPWRAILRIFSERERNTRAEPLTAEEAASLVHLVVDEVRAARRQIQGLTSIHLFIAAPAGVSFMLGTTIATLPPITAYEFDTATGRYITAMTVTS